MANCFFTFLFCIKCTCDACCVFVTATLMDIVFFGHWGLWNIWYIGRASNIFSILYLLFTLAFLLMFVFGILNLCLYSSLTQSGRLAQRLSLYLKIRFWSVVGLLIVGIVLFILALITFGSLGLAAGLPFLIGFFIQAVIVHGYHRCFVDSCGALTGGVPTIPCAKAAFDSPSVVIN